MSIKKLYVVTRKDLGIVYAGVQAGHGVAQWMLEHPEEDWNNSTLVYLVVSDLYQLNKWKRKLEYNKQSFSTFVEPDIGDELTALACYSEGKEFKNLKLLM